MTDALAVIAYFHAKPGKSAELEQILLYFVTQTRQEAGCIQYHLHRSNDDENLFVFYENFVSRTAWEEHNKRPFLAAFIAKKSDYLDREIEVVTCTMLSPFAVSAPRV